MLKNNDHRKTKITLREKFFLCVFGLFLCFVLLEVILRLSGFIYYSVYGPPTDNQAGYKILCIGESTTFGIGASNPSLQNYPHQLEAMLNKRFSTLQVQCFYDHNIGVNTTMNLIELPRHIKKYRPKLVIFMAGVNNWWNLDKSNILLFNKDKYLGECFLRISMFMDKFRVIKLFKWLAYSKGLMKAQNQINWPDELTSSSEEKINTRQKMASDLKSVLEAKYDFDIFTKVAYYDLYEMIKLCQDRQIKVIVCSYPRGSVNLASAHRKLAKSLKCHLVDNDEVFKKLKNSDEYFSSDGWHPNDKGYRIVSDNIYNCILENKLIE